MVNLHSAHMDPDDWQLPQQFRPERFLDELGNGTDRDRVIPFALGEILTASDFLRIIRCRVYVTVECPSVRPSVPSIDSSSGVQMICC